MRKFFLLTTFFTTAPIFLLFTLIYFLFISFRGTTYLTHSYEGKVAFAALPSTQNIFGDKIQIADSRTEILRQFFARYKSPLEPLASYFVKKAEEYQLDFRLLPAIAMQETNLCLKSQPDSYNCWGFGVYGGKYRYFDSYEQAIDIISKTLALRYRNTHGLVTPEEIEKMYNPNSSGAWAFSVNHFMDVME